MAITTVSIFAGFVEYLRVTTCGYTKDLRPYLFRPLRYTINCIFTRQKGFQNAKVWNYKKPNRVDFQQMSIENNCSEKLVIQKAFTNNSFYIIDFKTGTSAVGFFELLETYSK